MDVRFDLRELYRAVDSERQAQEVSWAALSKQVGVATSTIRRFGDGEDAEADGVLALIRWLGVAPEAFIVPAGARGEALQPAGDGFVRVDMKAIALAENNPRLVRGRTRTTIQHLVSVAHRSQRSVASLTRFSEV